MSHASFDDLFSRDPGACALPEGTVLFHAGDRADHAYVILDGEVEILLLGEPVDVAARGSMVGEMALLDASPRSATARARTDVRLVPIDQARFLLMIQQTPYFGVGVMRLMADRLRGMNAGA